MKTSWPYLEIAIPVPQGGIPGLAGVRRWLARALVSPVVLTEVVPVALATALAAVVRVTELTDIPPGLHGDEGLAGMDAARILREGWVGVYLPSALGTPSGTASGTPSGAPGVCTWGVRPSRRAPRYSLRRSSNRARLPASSRR